MQTVQCECEHDKKNIHEDYKQNVYQNFPVRRFEQKQKKNPKQKMFILFVFFLINFNMGNQHVVSIISAGPRGEFWKNCKY